MEGLLVIIAILVITFLLSLHFLLSLLFSLSVKRYRHRQEKLDGVVSALHVRP
jgi:hypothetical protein